MNTPAKVLSFLVALAVAFVAAMGVGAAVGPFDEPAPVAHEGMSDTHGGHSEEVGLPGGLAVSQDGYTLQLTSSLATVGDDVPLSFTIEGPDGAPVTEYDVEHEKRLHLVAVRRDMTGYQHVHPTMAGDGTWTTGLDLRPGDWRIFADFTPTGADGLTLGADLVVPGTYLPADPAPEARTAQVGDYTVTLDGDVTAGVASPLTLTVTLAGEPVSDLEPYLGAYGHLVTLREGDLAYLHVHPEESGPGPEIPFVVEVPTAGRYRLFLDFRHDGVVRTAALVVSTHEH